MAGHAKVTHRIGESASSGSCLSSFKQLSCATDPPRLWPEVNQKSHGEYPLVLFKWFTGIPMAGQS